MATIEKGKHTAGPWQAKIASARFEILGADSFPLLRINGGMIPVEADARLIAAAPELLNALELAEATILRLKQRYSLGSVDGTLDVVRAAIAKAEGE